jgi:hypothetical protein
MSLRRVVTQTFSNEISEMGEYAAFNWSGEYMRPFFGRLGR